MLGVKHETLLNYGAVSEQTVVEMALGVKNIMNTQYAIAVSGIAGPGGATPEKPVGSVWIAIATPQGTHAKLFNFGGRSRQLNIELTAKMGLYQLWRLLKGLEIN